MCKAELLTCPGLNKAKTVFVSDINYMTMVPADSDDVRSIQYEFSQTIVRWIAK